MEDADAKGTGEQEQQIPFVQVAKNGDNWTMTSNLPSGEAKWLLMTIAKELRRELE